MNRISEVGPADTVFVEFEVATDEIANAGREGVIYEILQFEALRRQTVILSHISFGLRKSNARRVDRRLRYTASSASR
jgi:hypothetical protein